MVTKVQLRSWFAGVILLFTLASCEEVFPGKLCTEEFRSIVVEIQGLDPEEVYTIRLATGDTLSFNKDNIPFNDKVWVVLDDSFMRILENRTEAFRFEAKKEGEVKIRQDFIIRSDGCHVELVDGPELIRY